MNDKNKSVISDHQAQKELEKRLPHAERILNDPDEIEKFLQRLAKKLRSLPKVGNVLSTIPLLMSLVRRYVKGEYTDIPLTSILAIIGALIYFLSPIDLIPDFIPFFGLLDDAAVLTACLALVGSDVEEYTKWRKENGLELDEHSAFTK